MNNLKIKFIIPIIIIFFLTSCTQLVTNTADETRMNTWKAELQNGSIVTLSFENDTAQFRVEDEDGDVLTRIKGLCFFDNKSMLIYNKSESEPYIFEYKIKNNKLVLSYGGGRLVLTREN